MQTFTSFGFPAFFLGFRSLALRSLAFGVIALAAVGCATTEQRVGFRPLGPVTAGEAGFPASRYQIPPEAPRGEAYVTSFGTRELAGGDGAREQLIHVRLAVANQNGEGDWSIDPAQQTLSAPGGPPQRPDFMEVDGKQGTSTAVPRGQRRVLDFYYRAPGGTDAGQLNGFDFQWQVNVAGRPLTERTAFAPDIYRDYPYGRSRVALGVGVVGPWWAYGYGPGWWGPYGYGGWGYPYYGYGPYYGVGVGWGRGYYGGYRGGGYGGGGYGGYGSRGGGGFGRGGGHAPVTRGRPGR